MNFAHIYIKHITKDIIKNSHLYFMNFILMNPKRFSGPKHISTWPARMVDSFNVVCLNVANHASSSNCIFPTYFAITFSSSFRGLHHRNNDFIKFFIVCWLNQCGVVEPLIMIYQLPLFVKFFLAFITQIDSIIIILVSLFTLLADICVLC